MAVFSTILVHSGKDNTEDGSALAVCEKLITDAGLTSRRGRVLTTDNWYTSVALATLLFEKYGWTLVGTIVPTDKGQREKYDIPFSKLSKGAKDQLERGWFREAVIEMKTRTGKKYYIQCTTWKDKKQVCFLSSNRVGSSAGKDITVLRGSKGTKKKRRFAGTIAQKDYAAMFAAVDRSDRDSADYSCTIASHRFYLRILAWALDRVLHMCYVVLCFEVMAPGSVLPMLVIWKIYTSKNGGRRKFQIQIGLDLMTYAISKVWDGKSERPDWMRQDSFVPCGCKKCYFCLNGHTTGIAHKAKKQKVKVVEVRTGLVTWTEQCTTKRVNLNRGCSYCRQCYRNLEGATDKKGNLLDRDQTVKEYKMSTMGCPQPGCDEHICKKCWAKGYDRHKTE